MASFTTPIASVATDSDLEDEISEAELARLCEDSNDGLNARTAAFKDGLYILKNRVPPIRENDLVDVTELTQATVYGAIARLYRNNITTGSGDDVNSTKFKHYHKLSEARWKALRPTVASNQIAGPSSIQFSRR